MGARNSPLLSTRVEDRETRISAQTGSIVGEGYSWLQRNRAQVGDGQRVVLGGRADAERLKVAEGMEEVACGCPKKWEL